MSVLPKLIYRFNTVPIKIPAGFLVETDRLIPKCTWNHKEPEISKEVLRKTNNTGSIDQGLIFAVKKLKALLGRLDIIVRDPVDCRAVFECRC